MTNSQPHTDPPTARQLSYLRDLAQRKGQTFVVPHSGAEASAEIERLKAASRQDPTERWFESVVHGPANTKRRAGYAPAVRDDEIEGYGSTARWR
jgi:Protein of unknown function (DUF3072)